MGMPVERKPDRDNQGDLQHLNGQHTKCFAEQQHPAGER